MNKKMIYICMVAMLLSCTPRTYGERFETLQDMQYYAQHMPEYPKSDNDNWQQPDFTSFYKEHKDSWVNRQLFKVGLKKLPVWWAHDFKNLLVDLVAYREQSGYSSRHIMHITPKPGDRFVLWGDLEGAYHSLIRDLVELERRGILNNNLEIVHPRFYFVFNGNVVNRSPYILETLTVVMQLMKKNPDRVFYIRGEDEDRENWYNFGTKAALKAKAHFVSSESTPLDSEMKRFFNTLPLALYLIAEQTKDEVKVVRISNHAASTNEIDEGMVHDFFELSNDDRPATYKVFDRKPSTKKVDIVAIIKGEDRSWRYSQTKGLVRLGFQEGGVAWSLLSSPTSTYRNLYDFFWDAFVILRVREKLSDWTLSLYNQDVRDRLGFTKSAEFSVTTGFEIEKNKPHKRYQDAVDTLQQKLRDLESELQRLKTGCPVQKEQDEVVDNFKQHAKELVSPVQGSQTESASVRPHRLILGTTGDLKKGIKGYTYAMNAGSKLVFDLVNKEGGIRNKQIELIAIDDSYDPILARQNIMRFLDEVGTDIIFNPIGSPTIVNYLDLIKDGKIVVLFPHTGTLAIRDEIMPYVINFQPSYYKEGEVLARYAVEKTTSRRFALLYQNDSYGIPPRDGALKELKKQGIKDENIMQISYDRNDVNLSKQAEQVQSFGPEIIFFFSTSAWAKSLIRNLGAGYFATKKCFVISLLSTKEFRDFMRYKGLSLIFTSQTPSPEYSQIPLVKEFRERAKKHNIDVDVSSLEGYIAAELTLYLLEKIPKDKKISKEAIVNAARSVVDQDYKGLKLSYNEKTNGLNNTIWLYTKEGVDWQSINTVAEGL